MDWGAIFNFAGKAVDYGTKAAALYSTVDSFLNPITAASPLTPAAPSADPSALTNLNAAADAKAAEEKRRRRALYENKNQTVMNTGGLGGLVTGAPVGQKHTLLGGA